VSSIITSQEKIFVDNREKIDIKKIHLLLGTLGQKPEEIPPESLDLYIQALTHSSYGRDQPTPESGTCPDNERLEFLGDRVLNLIVAEYLFCHFDETEGYLTQRMEVTMNRNLGVLVPSLGLGYEDLILVAENQPLTPGIIADAFEAFIGALYLDRGFDATRNIVLSLISDEIESFSPGKNYKKKLQETVQKQNLPLPVYSLVRKDGLDHRPVFTYRVTAGKNISGVGTGSSKAEATQNAALDALHQMGYFQGDIP